MKKYMVIITTLFLAMMIIAPGVMAEAVDAVPDRPAIDLTPLFQAVIAFLASLVTFKLVPWIRSRITASQQEKLRAFIKVFVFAAEQLFGAGNGKEKLMYVKGKLAGKGFHIDIDEIEAKVQELKLAQQPGGNNKTS